jgi:tetratricopeptide (TPR) repeat protein
VRFLFPLAAALCLVSPLAAQMHPDLTVARQRAVADSNDAGAHYDLAMAYWDRKQWDLAEASLRTAIQIAPAYADAYLALSALSVARGEAYWARYGREHGDSAMIKALLRNASYYRKAFLLNPLVNPRPLAAVDSIAGGAPPDMRDGVTALYQGNYALAFARLDEAKTTTIEAFNGSTNTLPWSLLWLHGLASAHIDSFEVAAQDFDNLLRQAKNREELHGDTSPPFSSNDYRYLVATMMYLGGHHEEAVAGLTRAVETDGSLFGARVSMAQIYGANGLWSRAINECQLAVDANPDDPGLLVELAATMIRGSRDADALQVLDHAARLNPRDPRIPFLTGHAALGAGRTEDARKSFTQFLAIAPSTYRVQIDQAKAELERLR